MLTDTSKAAGLDASGADWIGQLAATLGSDAFDDALFSISPAHERATDFGLYRLSSLPEWDFTGLEPLEFWAGHAAGQSEGGANADAATPGGVRPGTQPPVVVPPDNSGTPGGVRPGTQPPPNNGDDDSGTPGGVRPGTQPPPDNDDGDSGTPGGVRPGTQPPPNNGDDDSGTPGGVRPGFEPDDHPGTPGGAGGLKPGLSPAQVSETAPQASGFEAVDETFQFEGPTGGLSGSVEVPSGIPAGWNDDGHEQVSGTPLDPSGPVAGLLDNPLTVEPDHHAGLYLGDFLL